MKAAIWTAYGPPEVLQIKDVETPEPGPGKVRIKVEATTVTAGDTEMRELRFAWYFALPLRAFAGWRRPKRMKILGQEFAGIIDKRGEGATRFNVGDPVMAAAATPTLGGYGEYVVMPESPSDGMLERRPANLSAEEAAAIPFGAFEALHFLKKAGIGPGKRVLVIGGGGSIGSYGVQIAAAHGAEITAVDRPAKHAMLKEIGATRILDADARSFGPPARQGSATAIAANDDRGSAGFDIVLDVVGRRTMSRGIRALRRGGVYVCANPSFTMLARGLGWRLVAGKRVISGVSKHTPEAIAEINAMIADGRLKPVIGRTFPLDEIVAAHRYAESGEKIGNVAVRVG